MPRSIKIGRSHSNDLVLETDPTISRQHAIVTVYEDGRVTIRDLNSTSGTIVNGQKISTEVPLQADSVIKLGNTPLTCAQILSTPSGNRQGGAVAAGVPLSNRKTIGRAGDNTIVVQSPDVSGHHAAIGIGPDGNVMIEDLSSRNGTYVNGAKISGATVLRSGDKVRLASSTDLNWEGLIRAGKQRDNQTKKQKWLIPAVATVLVLIAVGLACFKFIDRPWDAQKIFSHYKNSVVMIYNESTYRVTLGGRTPSSIHPSLAMLDNLIIDKDGDVDTGTQAGTGTGFFISPDGKIMTNKHVLYPIGDEVNSAEKIKNAVENYLYSMARQTGDMGYAQLASDIKVDYTILWSGVALNDTHVSNKNDFIPATAIKKSDNDDVDVAVLQTNTKTTPEGAVIVDVVNYSKPDDLEIGDKVYTIGFPKGFTIGDTSVGLEANNQSGEVTQERGENEYGHNITIHQGASGSPVFDAYGRFAGIIVSGYLGISQGYNHAIRPEKAAQFAN